MSTLPNINFILPDDCLRMIFKRLPLQEQIRIRSCICSRWFQVLSQMFTETRSLKLFDSYMDLAKLERAKIEHNFDSFKMPFNDILIVNNCEGDEQREVFDAAKCYTLPTLFPNLNSIALNTRSQYEYQVPKMLEQWSAQLSSLLMCALPNSIELIPLVWNAVAQMSRLTELRAIGLFRHEFPCDLPIFGRLNKFILIHYLSDLTPMLSQLKSCKCMCLSWVYLSESQLCTILQQNSQLAQTLKHLSIGFISAPNGVNREKNFRQVFHFICHNFTQLESMDMLFADHPLLIDLIPSLHKLHNLTEIWLYIGRDQLDHSEPAQLPQLKSIQNLFLEIFDLSIEQFFEYIVWLFPNLSKLTLRCPDFDVSLRAQLELRLMSELRCLQTCKFRFE